MLFETPDISGSLAKRLDELETLRRRLGEGVGTFSPWIGMLRRELEATAAESSLSIEGYEVSHEEARAAVAGRDPQSDDDENRMAVSCYARAMDHVGVMATDPGFGWSERAILDLHFDACYFQRDRSPGHWRTGPIAVTSGTAADGIAYRGPPSEQIPELMSEVVEWLESGDLDASPVIRAAMAHLHIVSVHPFRDGNGRVARIVQSLVLAREGLVSQAFGSIEEYLAGRTTDYYEVLQEVQGGSYRPERSAEPWIEFCIDAHLAQAGQRLAQVEAAGARWSALEALVEERGWPERLVIALEQSLIGGADRRGYIEESGVSVATASADFRRLTDAGLVERTGSGRNAGYRASEQLRASLG